MIQKGIIRSKYGLEVQEVGAIMQEAIAERDSALKMIDSIKYQDEAEKDVLTELAMEKYEQAQQYCLQFKEIHYTDQPEDGDVLTGYRPYYEEVDDHIIQKWEPLENNPMMIHMEVNRLKKLLKDGDYKVQKNAEYLAVGAEPPYDLMELHTTRQQWRDRINELEVLLTTIPETLTASLNYQYLKL